MRQEVDVWLLTARVLADFRSWRYHRQQYRQFHLLSRHYMATNPVEREAQQRRCGESHGIELGRLNIAILLRSDAEYHHVGELAS